MNHRRSLYSWYSWCCFLDESVRREINDLKRRLTKETTSILGRLLLLLLLSHVTKARSALLRRTKQPPSRLCLSRRGSKQPSSALCLSRCRSSEKTTALSLLLLLLLLLLLSGLSEETRTLRRLSKE
jgi:hypothetical protein